MPAQTRIIHYYVCLGAAGGKEWKVNMMNFLLALYSSLLIKILPLLVVSLLLTFLLVKAKMPKLFYLLIVVEVIAISVLHYSTVVTSISLYMEERVWIILFNMAILVGIYLMIPILSIILYRVLRKRVY